MNINNKKDDKISNGVKYQPPRAMKEIHDIRLVLYEERKNLTPTQKVHQTNRIAEQILKNHQINLKLASAIKETK